MAQYTFSYKNSEYDRIPLELSEKSAAIISASGAPSAVKDTLRELMAAVQESVSDLAAYARDGLKL
jgi:hypothetical protein